MLTKRQQDVLRVIKQFQDENGFSPTSLDIANRLKIQSRGVVYRYLKALVKHGYIELIPNRHRNIRLIPPTPDRNATVPVLGQISAGQPIEAITDLDCLNVVTDFAQSGCYGLIVRGDSMITAGILDGDIVICCDEKRANPGDIVVALIDNQEATLKYYHPSTTDIVLKPGNPAHQDQRYDANRVTIQGVYCGLVRSSRAT